jgi:hypothetical protein
MTMGLINQKAIIIVHMHAHTRVSRYMKHKLIEQETDNYNWRSWHAC